MSAKIRLGLSIAGAIAVLAWQPHADAHHGGTVEWNQEQVRGPITGVATRFAFQFPHVQLFAEMTNEHGEQASWTLVIRWTPTILRKNGWSRDSIKPGDEVTVTYFPHVDSPTTGLIQSIEVNGEPLPMDL